MSACHQNRFPFEKKPLNIYPLFLILGLVYIIFKAVKGVCKYFSASESCVQYQLGLSQDSKVEVGTKNQDSELPKKRAIISEKKIDDGSLSREEVEMVMERLGISCHPKGEQLEERLGSNDLSSLFEEKEPSLDEVKEAFDVFDENRDGFIDAGELQRVLDAFSLRDRSDIDDCKRMIRVFDENADGRIDFNEFVKFMESSFC
ncbi:hypothetical protein RJ640_025670 [Escallonia rubra]|uniref:EF-hand domain-containing protein n=1 Tax=Escallonia rubra TaxID=112253 RepID=A0AA88S999_9ASTE|nr:hypothetical protein RJ640_025670 [Escallonia rubra]